MNAGFEYLLIGDEAGHRPRVERHLWQILPQERAWCAASRAELEAVMARSHAGLVLFTGDVPGLDVPGVLELLRARGLDWPLIVVGERIGEEAVAELFKLGIADFVPQDNLARLLPAMERCRPARRDPAAGPAQSAEKPFALFEHGGEAERRTKTEELHWKSAFLEALIHSSEDGIVVVDNQGRKIFQNQKVMDLWKLPPEIAADPDERAQHEFLLGRVTNPEEFTARWKQVLARPDEPAQDEVALRDGTVLHRYTSLVRDPEGKSYGRVWIFRDITKQREMETQFRQAQKMEAVGTLAGGIAHDFNNILCSIFGYGYLLQQEPADSPEAREHLAEMLKAASRAKDLVQQILTFSRRREQKREMIRLAPVIKEAAKFLRASLPASIRIEIDVDDDAPAVLADPTQIYQIAMNLATNALHAMEGRPGRLLVMLTPFTPDDSFIRLHPELRPGRYTRLTVADTGHGMDAKTLERIFEPFFTTKPVGQGTGLGLAVVHGIVQSHEGVITVASTPGRGTTFDIYLPAQAVDATPMQLTATDIPRGRGGTILFLDDEPALTKPMQRLLEGLNYHVSLSNNPGDALRSFAADAAKYNLVITDLMMPEMDGFEVARHIHDIRPDIPVMLISGHAPDMSHDELHAAGISAMLEKPFSLSDLAEMVKSLV